MLKSPEALQFSIDAMLDAVSDVEFDTILGPESRGFIFGMPMAYSLGKSFVPVRKAGKLPAEVGKKIYDLEYGSATIEIHKDAVKNGQKFLLVDDLLATGGTAKAVCDLIKEMGGTVVAHAYLIELSGLGGNQLLKGHDIRSILKYTKN